VKTSLLLLAVAGMLLGAASAYAGQSANGANLNGASLNGIALNGVSMNGFQYRRKPTQSVQRENLPWGTVSHRRLGKSSN
jgi:hypothetical protein